MSPLPFEASTTTHIFANDNNFEGYNDALQNNVAVVTVCKKRSSSGLS